MANHMDRAVAGQKTMAMNSKLNPQAPSFIPENQNNQTLIAANEIYLSPPIYSHFQTLSTIALPAPPLPLPQMIPDRQHHGFDQTVVMRPPIRYPPTRPVRGSPSRAQGFGSRGRGVRVWRERNRRFHDCCGGSRQRFEETTMPRKMSYVRKTSDTSMASSSSRVTENGDESLLGDQGNNVTTLMIRNVPSKYTRRMLMDFIDSHCMLQNQSSNVIASGDHDQDSKKVPNLSAYDFLYLPIDFRSKLNKGYAFVNFTSPEAATAFEKATRNQKWVYFQSSKIREIAIATLQGKDQLVKHFERVKFGCEDEEFLPVWFKPARNGSNKELVNAQTVGELIGHRRNYGHGVPS